MVVCALAPELWEAKNDVQEACDQIGDHYQLTTVVTRDAGGKTVREITVSGSNSRWMAATYGPDNTTLEGKAEQIRIDRGSEGVALYVRESLPGDPDTLGDWELREEMADVASVIPCLNHPDSKVRRVAPQLYTWLEGVDEDEEDEEEVQDGFEFELQLDEAGMPHRLIVQEYASGDHVSRTEHSYSNIGTATSSQRRTRGLGSSPWGKIWGFLAQVRGLTPSGVRGSWISQGFS